MEKPHRLDFEENVTWGPSFGRGKYVYKMLTKLKVSLMIEPDLVLGLPSHKYYIEYYTKTAWIDDANVILLLALLFLSFKTPDVDDL